MRRQSKKHTLPILIILICSLVLGFVFELACTGVERLTHRRQYRETVSAYAAQYGIPEAAVFALIKRESNFDSTKQGKNGEIGLLQLTPALYTQLANQEHDTAINAAALYDPDTNLHYGTMYLARLYRKYGMWSTVYAAWYAGEDTVDAWLANPDLTDPDFGTLLVIPDKTVARAAKRAVKTMELYEKLYYAK